MNSLNSAAAQARIDDLLRTAGNARRARGARNRRVSSLFQLRKP